MCRSINCLARLAIALHAILIMGFSTLSAQAQTEPPAAAGTAPSVNPFPAAPLPPLKRIVLYNSGVGQMEYRGPIDGNARIEIRSSGHDVDDVLKSLVFTDSGDGHVALIRHAAAPGPAGDPADYKLGDCATQRNLSEQGRTDARALGERFRAQGVKVGKVMSSQWGSLAPNATVALDLALVLARPGAFEYVLVHELCHLIRPDHSRAFWREVEARFPQWRAERDYFHAEGRQLKASLRALLG